MLIPLIFKNNDAVGNVTKIGKVTPALARLLYAFSLTKKTGVLKDYAGECSITAPIDYVSNIGFARVTFNKGVLSVCGGIAYIEQGTTFDIPVTEQVTTGSLGVRVDLAKPEGEEMVFYHKTSALVKQDLQTNEVSGVYEFEIYKYSVDGGIFTLGAKTEEVAESVENALIELKNNLETGATIVEQANKASSIIFVTTAPTESPPANTLVVYIGSATPPTRYSRVLYLIT